MKRICAWCKKGLGAEESESEREITHGICSLCALEVTRGTARTAKSILGHISEPVFLVDRDGVVKAANGGALRLLHKDISDIEDHLGGDVFECTYAKSEEGCGRSIHCTTCAIRNIVTDTLISGTSHAAVPAYQSIDTPDGPRILRFTVSTERVDQMIFLRIDEVRPSRPS